MKLHELTRQKGFTKSKKRVGRGYGSGKGGHTTGRGTKGQKARSQVRPGFEGGQNPLYKRLPKAKGFKSLDRRVPHVVNVRDLNKKFEDGEVVSRETLTEAGLISPKAKLVKILGNGELTKKVTIKGLEISATAKEKVTKAGGKVE